MELEKILPESDAHTPESEKELLEVVEKQKLETPDGETRGLKSFAGCVKGLAVFAALTYLLVYLAMAYVRVPYPFELEWLEGGMAQAVQRTLEGKPIYTRPSVEYASFIYTPLYTWTAAAICKFTGVSFLPMRLISFVSSLGCFAVILLHVRRETKSWLGGLIGMGLFAATFRIGGAWFDVARVDSMFVFLLLLAIYLARFAKSRMGYAFAGFVLSLAYLTKQSDIAVAGPLCLMCLIVDWRKAWPMTIVPWVFVGAITAVMELASHGWYSYYLFELPMGHSSESIMWLGYWRKDLAAFFGFACAGGLMGMFAQLARPGWKNFIFYFVVTFGIVIMCYASRVHVGGYDNVLMPVYAWISLLFGLAIGACRALETRPRHALTAGLCALAIVQFIALIYNPLDQVPSQKDREAGERLLAMIEEADGDVFIPYHNFYPAMVGKKVFAHREGINVFLGDRNQARDNQRLLAEIQKAIREQQFGLVIMNSKAYSPELQAFYKPITGVFRDNDEFRPVTGLATRPVYFYVPKKGE